MKDENTNRVAIITGGASGETRLKLACEMLGELAGYIACDLAKLAEGCIKIPLYYGSSSGKQKIRWDNV